ncbi:MAG: DapH/DapD/GlmU-related protein [Promethearchaeota archaeon]
MMSSTIPASLKTGPTTTNTLSANRYLIIYIFIIWFSLIPDFFLILFLISILKFDWILFITFPIILIVIYMLFIVSALFFSWLTLKFVNFFNFPKEGVFPKTMKNKDYRAWIKRAVIRKFPIWLCHNVPFPWVDILAFKVFGNHVKFTTPLYDAWVDSEFLEIGKGSTIGQGAVIMTSMITTEFLIIKRVIIGKNCLIGGHSVIAPGTILQDNVLLGALSSTQVSQELESGWVYMGSPAQKYRENKFREEDELTAEERANIKGYKEIIEEFPEDIELKGRRVVHYIHKSAKKDLGALKSLGKAENRRIKGDKYQRRSELRAERHEMKADRKKFESGLAKEKAKQILIKKDEKDKYKTEKKESRALKTQDQISHIQDLKIVKKYHEKVDKLKEIVKKEKKEEEKEVKESEDQNEEIES